VKTPSVLRAAHPLYPADLVDNVSLHAHAAAAALRLQQACVCDESAQLTWPRSSRAAPIGCNSGCQCALLLVARLLPRAPPQCRLDHGTTEPAPGPCWRGPEESAPACPPCAFRAVGSSLSAWPGRLACWLPCRAARKSSPARMRPCTVAPAAPTGCCRACADHRGGLPRRPGQPNAAAGPGVGRPMDAPRVLPKTTRGCC
jgi:hypothetical protein